jgi:hypothetical protein
MSKSIKRQYRKESDSMPVREERVEQIQGIDQEMQEIREAMRAKAESGNRRQALRQQVQETHNEQTVQSLEQVFAAKLALVRSYQRKLTTVQDPYARKVLQRMIQEERNQLMSLADLIDLVQQGPDMGPVARTRAKMGHQVRSSSGRSVALGIGIAVVGMMLYPMVREKFRPMVAKAMEGVMDMADQAQQMIANMKEGIEDIVSEAQFERFKDMPETSFTDADFDFGPDFDMDPKQ